MKKPILLHGLGNAKEFSHLKKHFTIPKIDWNNSKITPPLKEKNLLIGFSLGCMLACMHAEKTKVKKLILCSPTPDETLSKVKADEVVFIYGENEKWVEENVWRVANTLKCNYEIVILPNTGHKITKKYLLTILARI